MYSAGDKARCAFPASIRWTAPEILSNPVADEDEVSTIFSQSCDVYSFSMVLWEILVTSDPYEDIPDEAEVSSIVVKVLCNMMGSTCTP